MIKVFEPCLTKEDLAIASQKCLESGQFDPGQYVDQFEAAIAKYLGVPASWVMVTNSCTSALTTCYHFLVKNHRLQAPVLTWPGSYCGHPYDILFYDEVPKEPGPAVVVDLYGRGLIPECRARPLIIDAAHNCLSRRLILHWLLPGKADAICFSFGPTKQLTTIRGGAIISPHISGQWRSYIHFGAHGRIPHLQKGGNYTMPDFNAVIGLEQMARFGDMQECRRTLLFEYGKGHIGALTDVCSSGHMYAIRNPVKERPRLALEYAGIQTSHHYPLPAWVNPDDFPASRDLSIDQLTLPLHLGLTTEDVRKIVSIVKANS